MKKIFLLVLLCWLFSSSSSLPAQTRDDVEVIGAQLLVGEGWRSRLTVKNLDPIRKDVFIYYPANLYRLIAVSLDGGQETLWHIVGLEPNESRTVLLTSSSPTTLVGWVQIDGFVISPGAIGGTLERQQTVGGQVIASFASPLAKVGKKFRVENAVFTQNAATALAVVNHNLWPTYFAQVFVRAIDLNGKVIAEVSVDPTNHGSLRPSYQDSRFIHEFFAGNTDWAQYLLAHGEFRGTVEVEVRSTDLTVGFTSLNIIF